MECGQICTADGSGKNGKPVAGDLFSDEKNDNECVQRHDVGREFLAFRRQQRKVGVLCEPHYRRVAGPGHGAQAGVVVVDEDLQR